MLYSVSKSLTQHNLFEGGGQPPPSFFIMDFEHGLLMFFIGTTATITGFFIAFMVVNYNRKKELDDEQERERQKIFGDTWPK